MKGKTVPIGVFVLIALVGICTVVLVLTSPSPVGSENTREFQVPSAQNFQVVDRQGKVVYGEAPYRITFLSKSLGIPVEELEKLSPEEVMQLFIDNAAKLEINVYKSVQNESGQWVPVLVAKGRGTVDQSTPTSIP